MKRLLKLSILIPIFLVVEILNYLGFLIDEIVYPAYRKLTIKSPVFIVGMPRSATSFLYTLLALDTEKFTAMKLWEILLAPSVIQKKFVCLVARIDKHLNNILRKTFIRLDKRILADYSPIHPMSFFKIEEDELLFFHIFTTGHLLFWFPSIKKIYKNIRFEEELSERSKLRHLGFYRRCIKKHLFTFGQGRIYLAKSPVHSSKINSLKSFFPDSIFIHNIRIPHEVIPSTISMFQMFSRIFSTPVNTDELTRWVLAIADYWYYCLIEQSKMLPENRFINVRFNELTEHPVRVIEFIYQTLHYNLSDDFKILVMQEHRAVKTNIHQHCYSLEQYNLDKDQIQNRYKTIYHEYFVPGSKQKRIIPFSVVQD